MKHFRGAILAVILTIGLLFLYYSPQIVNADHIAYGQSGDGYKNYYTIAYYLKYDSGAHFSGMNYPYGENVMFTDNQPVISWTLKAASKVFPSISNHIHGYIGLAFFLSVVISSFLLFKILLQLGVSEINSALAAVLIAMMAPQFSRLDAHFSLEYTCYIPLIFLLLIKLFKTNGSLRIFFYLLFTLIFFSFIHLYYLAMASLFILLIVLTHAVSKFGEIKKHIRLISLLSLAAIIPFAVVKLFFILTDSVNDRPKAPWGFIESRSTWADIFLSPFSFSNDLMNKLLPPGAIEYHWEGTGYIGLIATVALLCALVISLKFILAKRKSDFNLYPLNYFIIPAIIVLLFAMAFPFNIHRFEKYYERMPSAFKQFRASGRFNWVFYYTATILSVLIIDGLFKKLFINRKIWAYSFVLGIYSVWFIEVNMMSNRREEILKSSGTEATENKESEVLAKAFIQSGISPKKFQAIMPLPFFLNGSEKIYLITDASYKALKASLYTGLPIACGQMSRTSLSQTLKMANLLGDDLTRKDVIKDYPNTKPLLLITEDNSFLPAEQKLIDKARFLFAINNEKYYELPLSAFSDTIDAAKNYFVSNKNIFTNHGDYYSNDTLNNTIVKSFDGSAQSYAIFGNGAFYSNTGLEYFYDNTLPNAKDSAPYEISMWFNSDNRVAAYPVIYIVQYDSTGKEVGKGERDGKFSTNAFNKWVRGQIDFTLYNKKNKITVLGTGKHTTYDEVMIRPKNVTVITQFKNDSTFMFNNYPVYRAGY